MNNAWHQSLFSLPVVGPALTAAAAASCLVAAAPAAGQTKPIIPGGLLVKANDRIHVLARGIISCVITTPGTARFDLRMGAVVVFDTGALNLNIVAKVNVPWALDVDLVLRTPGTTTAANLWAQGTFSSEAVIGSPLPSVGGNGILNVPVSGLAVSTGFDSSVANTFDCFFTQTVATGSMTVEQFDVTYCN